MTARTTDAQALLKPSPKTMPARSRQGISRLQTTELILCYSELPVHLLALRRYCIAINLWERKHRKVSGRQQRYCITGELTAIVTVIDSLVEKKTREQDYSGPCCHAAHKLCIIQKLQSHTCSKIAYA